jgi:SAM-dependent methyltransferase
VTDSEHVLRNRGAWDSWAKDYEAGGHRNWSTDDVSWGVFSVPEEVVGALPDVTGKDVVELGCGTGYVSAWLSRRGARTFGIDNSSGQLTTATALQAQFGPRFPLLQANAEAVPVRDESFDVAISEYGASIWCDPYRWIPEAARVLRSGGELIFLVNATLVMLCVPDTDAEGPATERLRRPYFGMHRFEWPDDSDGSVEFHLGYGDWIRLFRANGFDIEDLIEIRPLEGATTNFPYVTPEWAQQWPCEEVWKVRKR